MFKSNYSHNLKKTKDLPYYISFECNADISKGVKNRFYYERFYTSKKETLNVISKVDQLLNDVFFVADLVYFRILSLGNFQNKVNYSSRDYLTTFRSLQEAKNQIQKDSIIKNPVYKNISNLVNFIDSVLSILFYYTDHEREIQNLFNHLNAVKENFIQSYRNYCVDANIIHLEFLKVSAV